MLRIYHKDAALRLELINGIHSMSLGHGFSNHTYVNVLDATTHPCANFMGGQHRVLKLGRECEITGNHDDVIKWKHFPRYWPFVLGIHRSTVKSPQRPVTRSFDVLFDVRLNKQLSNTREAGDLRRHRAHYDVSVMC